MSDRTSCAAAGYALLHYLMPPCRYGTRVRRSSDSECCAAAPPILEFNEAGDLIGHWGGPGEGYEWPSSNHGIDVDYKGNVWIGGNGRGDQPALGTWRQGRGVVQNGRGWSRKAPPAGGF